MYHALVGNDEKIPLFDFYVFISDDVFSVAAFDIDRFDKLVRVGDDRSYSAALHYGHVDF